MALLVAATGGVIGALTEAGLSKDDSETYAEGVRRGGTLVSARIQDADRTKVESILIAPLLMFRHGELHGRNLDGNRSTPRRSHIPPMKSARNVRSTEQTSPLSLTRKPGEIPGLSLGLFAYQRRP
jgi:hypothetical protein